MRIFSTFTSPKVNLFSGNNSNVEEWSIALRKVGLRVSSPRKSYTAYRLEQELVLILDPANTTEAIRFIKKNQLYLHNLYIVSNEPLWKKLNEEYHFNLLTKETHPLETARMVIHSAKASQRPQNYFARYASLFNF